MNQAISLKFNGIKKENNLQKQETGLFSNICKTYNFIIKKIKKISNQISENNLLDIYQHPWVIKDISKDGNQIYKINDQKDLEIFSEKILVSNDILLPNNNNGMTLRDVLNDYFRQSSSAKQNEKIVENSIDLNLIKVEKFVGVNSFNQEKYNISICKFIQNQETQIVLKIDNISLQEKVEQLEEWDHQKDQILFNITHDLKTPLNAIMHMISEAKEQTDINERNETLQFAYCNSEMLLSLIHDILDFAQLKQKKLKIDLQEINLIETVGSVLQIMKVQTELKQIDLRLKNTISPSQQYLTTDPRRLKQILINLLSNAIKFTTTGYIEVNLSFVSPYYKFEIIDTGTGIQPSVISKLCQPFQTFGNEKYKNSTGVGLGLCFCKEIVGVLGPFEELFIDSIYGTGSKFGFLINDQSNGNEINYQGVQSFKEYFSDYSDIEEFNVSVERPHRLICNYLNHTQATIENPNGSQLCLNCLNCFREEASADASQINVLIADDCLFNIVVLKQQLSKLKEYQFNIFQAYNGEMAINTFKQFNKKSSKCENLSIIFMDCNMPIMDGYKATEQIKLLIQEEDYGSVNVIALSAQILEESRYCFDFILQKPCSVSELERVINLIQMQGK